MPEITDKKRSPASLLARGLWVIISFTLAVGLALLLLVVLGGNVMGNELREGYQPEGELGTLVDILSMLFGGASFLIVLTPTLSLLPALIAVIIGEVAQLRSALYYIVAGGLAVVALPLLGSPADTSFDTQFLTIFATAGFAGGLLYWLLAGRNA